MPEVARCNTIEIGEAVVRAGLKIEACDQIEQALIGAIRERDRQRFFVKSFDVAADYRAQQSEQGPLPGLVPAQSCEFLLENVDAAAKARGTSCSCQPLQIIEEATDLYGRPRLRSMVIFASLGCWLCSYPLTAGADCAFVPLSPGRAMTAMLDHTHVAANR